MRKQRTNLRGNVGIAASDEDFESEGGACDELDEAVAEFEEDEHSVEEFEGEELFSNSTCFTRRTQATFSTSIELNDLPW
jgi:hypothetical protein